MIFQENRRLALVLCIFMLIVFFLCAFVDFSIHGAYVVIFSAVLSGLTAVCFILRFTNFTAAAMSGKSNNKIYNIYNKIKIICGILPVFFLPVIAAVFFCVLRYNISEKPVLDYLEKYKDTPAYIKAEIKKASGSAFMSSFDLKVFEVNDEKTKKFNLSLTVFGEIEAGSDEIGDILETYVVFGKLENDSAARTSIAYAKSGGYYISAEHAEYAKVNENGEITESIENIRNIESAESAENAENAENDAVFLKITPAERRTLEYYLDVMKSYARDTLFKNTKLDYHDNITEEAAIVFGVFTGYKDYIEPHVKLNFARAGIAHVLSVSGLHLSILCAIISALLDASGVHKKIRCVAVILFCLFFMAFAGFSVSVVRAGIMMILFYSAFLIGQKSDSVTSLFVAGTIIIFLFGPYITLHTGFKMSFMATLGIITTSNLREKTIEKINSIKKLKFLTKLLKIIVSSFYITIAAVSFTLPITSYDFGALSLMSPITNLLTTPLITAILFLAFLMMIFSFLEFMLFIFGLPLYFITKLLLSVTEFLSQFKYAYISVKSTITGDLFYILAIIFLITVIICLYVNSKLAILEDTRKNKRIRLGLYSSVAVSFIIMSAALVYPRILFKDSVRIAYYSDDKNQNIILFNKDYDSADIIDISHGTLSHIFKTYEILAQNGAVSINSIILTHYHKRHVNMLKRYMNYSSVNKVYIPAPVSEYDTEVFNALYYLSTDKNKGFELVKYGGSLDLENGGITITKVLFDYNKMQHIIVNIIYYNESIYKNFLYLGIGYEDGFSNYTDNMDYDVVFYGTHKHNRRDDNYISDVYGTFAGVLSGYLDNNKNKTTQKLTLSALDKYLTGSALFLSDDYNSIVFEINKTGEIKYYIK